MYEEYDGFHPFTPEQKDQLRVIVQELGNMRSCFWMPPIRRSRKCL